MANTVIIDVNAPVTLSEIGQHLQAVWPNAPLASITSVLDEAGIRINPTGESAVTVYEDPEPGIQIGVDAYNESDREALAEKLYTYLVQNTHYDLVYISEQKELERTA